MTHMVYLYRSENPNGPDLFFSLKPIQTKSNQIKSYITNQSRHLSSHTDLSLLSTARVINNANPEWFQHSYYVYK